MPSISVKKNIWLSLAGLAIALTFLAYLSLLGQISKKKHELDGLTNQVSASSLELSGLSGDAGGRGIFKEAEASLLVDKVIRQAKACSLEIKSASQKEIRALEDGYMALPLQLEVESKFEQLGIFLGSLDRLEGGLAEVDSFQILGIERPAHKISAFLSLNLYLQKDINE